MVAVHVGDENAPQLGHAQRAAQKLVLSTLAAVEQPELGALGEAQGDRRHISGAGGNA
jgi:hypothetical protein